MKHFSQNIINYHGCGACYLDGTNEIAKFGCLNATFNPFWKRPIDVNNKVSKSTRSRIKNKPHTTRKYVKKYFRYLRFLEKNKNTQWSDTDCSTDCSDYAESKAESETESKKRWSETGEDLVIDIEPSCK